MVDGELAWAIASWTDNADLGIEEVTLNREQIISLANHLSAAGFSRGDSGELSLGDLRKLATKAKTSIAEFIKETGAPAAS